MPKGTPTPRFPEYLPDENGCWIWQRSLRSTGYGNYSYGKSKVLLAHRVIYERFRGSIPPKTDLDHLCRVPACVNPYHLEPVTHRENILRGESPSAQNARKTHCLRGHEFTEANTYHRPDNPSTRLCILCRRIVTKARRERMKVA